MSFQWISNETKPAYITIDKQHRLYLSQGTRKLLSLQPKEKARLICGYDPVNHRIVIAKPDVVRAPGVRPFPFDKRGYSKAKSFVKNAGISEGSLPLRFNYVGEDYSDSPEGSYAFERADFKAPDSKGVARGLKDVVDPNEPLGGQ